MTLDATATVTDAGKVSYVWCSATAASKTGAAIIGGATSATYAPAVNVAGTFYYYCVVTNKNNAATGVKTATVTSAVSTVTVVVAEAESCGDGMSVGEESPVVTLSSNKGLRV